MVELGRNLGETHLGSFWQDIGLWHLTSPGTAVVLTPFIETFVLQRTGCLPMLRFDLGQDLGSFSTESRAACAPARTL